MAVTYVMAIFICILYFVSLFTFARYLIIGKTLIFAKIIHTSFG